MEEGFPLWVAHDQLAAAEVVVSHVRLPLNKPKGDWPLHRANQRQLPCSALTSVAMMNAHMVMCCSM